jgi:hypothetical protein
VLWTGLKINGNDKIDSIPRIKSGNTSKTSFGVQDFLDFKYKKLKELSTTVKSPYLADLERRVNPYK